MKKVGELHPLETPQGLWQEISTDIIGLLLRSNDKNTMMIIVDQFKKMIGLKIITIIVPSEEIAKIYSDNI